MTQRFNEGSIAEKDPEKWTCGDCGAEYLVLPDICMKCGSKNFGLLNGAQTSNRRGDS